MIPALIALPVAAAVGLAALALPIGLTIYATATSTGRAKALHYWHRLGATFDPPSRQ